MHSQDIWQQVDNVFEREEAERELMDRYHPHSVKWYRYGRGPDPFNQNRYRNMFAQEVLKSLGVEF